MEDEEEEKEGGKKKLGVCSGSNRQVRTGMTCRHLTTCSNREP